MPGLTNIATRILYKRGRLTPINGTDPIFIGLVGKSEKIYCKESYKSDTLLLQACVHIFSCPAAWCKGELKK